LSRMFSFVTKSWNPVVGCLHDCYAGRCWARIMARRLQGMGRRKYHGGFSPRLWSPDLAEIPRLSENHILFVVSMGDLFGSWVPRGWITRTISKCHETRAKCFFETKNPKRYWEFEDLMRKDSILSTTIETDRDYQLSKAPPITERIYGFMLTNWEQKHVSVEPIADFSFDPFLETLIGLEPKFGISIGFDNYQGLAHLGVPEPPPSKVELLAKALEQVGFRVERKWKGRK